jgi:hypothetical protein
MRSPCPRTPVHYVSGLYTLWGEGFCPPLVGRAPTPDRYFLPLHTEERVNYPILRAVREPPLLTNGSIYHSMIFTTKSCERLGEE